MSVKSKIKRLIVLNKYRKKKIKLANTANVSIKAYFGGYNKIGSNTSFNGILGYGSYIANNSNLSASIGKFCSIGSNVKTISGNHPTNSWVTTHPAFFSTKKQANFSFVEEDLFDELPVADELNNLSVKIGNDVWICDDVKILGGVTIGDGAIIAAGAIVVRDVEPYSIYGGVPAKMLRKRFNNEEIEYLMGFCWWDKTDVWLREHANLFKNIEEFIRETKNESM